MEISYKNLNSRRVAVFISGRGSNLKAMLNNEKNRILNGEISFIYSNEKNALGLNYAKKFNKDFESFPYKKKNEGHLLRILKAKNIDIIALAGFMKILSSHFIAKFKGLIVNIHPALLPSFPGLNAQKQAYDYGTKISGVTVHFVDNDLDGGIIIKQRAINIENCGNADAVTKKILRLEHKIYTEALNILLTKKWHIEGRHFIYE